MTPKPQTDTLDEIKNSHTMKLVPLSQRELFWHELKPKLQALIAEARIEKIDELVAEVLKAYYPEDIFTPTTADDKEKFNAINANAHSRIHCDGIRHGLHQLRRLARDLSPKEDLEIYRL